MVKMKVNYIRMKRIEKERENNKNKKNNNLFKNIK